MLLVLPEFDLLYTHTVAETCSLLSSYAGDAQILAGGTDLLIRMKHKRMIPRHLINIKKIPDLDQIHHDERDGLQIGALTTIQSIKESAIVDKKYAVLHQAAAKLGTTQIRNLATLGGNLANASPAADCAVALMVLGASVKCEGRGGERIVALEDFFVAPGKSALQQDEILTQMCVPNLPSRAEGIYLKHSLRRMDVAIAGAAILVVFDGDVCRDARIALGAVAPTPFRARKAEETLRGQRLAGDRIESELLEEVARIASDESLPIDDIRGQAGYRQKVVRMLVSKGLEQVLARARS